MASKEYTHADLVARGARWLRNTVLCKAVLAEFPAPTGEIPDVIGWKWNGRSVMIECKTSRADFLADAKKPWRMNLLIAVGAERYFLAPPKTIGVNELPTDWGLLEIRGNGIHITVPARPRKDLRSEVAIKTELRMLVSALTRVAIRLQPANLSDWLHASNRETSIEQMQTFTSESEEDLLARKGWSRVVDPDAAPIDPASEEPWCNVHEELLLNCSCIKPYADGVVYQMRDGVSYGRRVRPASALPDIRPLAKTGIFGKMDSCPS